MTQNKIDKRSNTKEYAHWVVYYINIIINLYLIIQKIPSGEEWIGCSLGIESFVVTYNPVDSPDDKRAHNVDDSDARKATVNTLSPCTEYEFVIHITNRDYQGPDSNRSLATTNSVG